MKQSTVQMLCCPLCKGELELQIETKSNENIAEGSMVCHDCKNKYLIHNGIPRMYITDNEIIALSNNKNFSKFIITSENLDKCIKNSKTRKQSTSLTNQVLTKFLGVFAWILLFSSIIILILSSVNLNIAMINEIPSWVVYLLLGISVTFFVIDYSRYRIGAEVEYSTNLRTLKKSSDQQELGEYHLHIATEDREEDFKNEFAIQKDFTAYKGKKIAWILNNYNFKVKNALNVGCGGALSKSISKPYFDKGYDMIGVDVSEEYLEQFNEIFNADVIQANGIALPFGNNNFDLVNFTDILEHLHHPLLGLSEAQRVLKVEGVIILTTPNHCAFPLFRCLNPLIFFEKAISLHYDRILPPRNILTHWMGLNFYHTEFSKDEITRLVKAAGFEILSFETGPPDRDKLNRISKKFPALRFMGSEFVIIGKKKQ